MSFVIQMVRGNAEGSRSYLGAHALFRAHRRGLAHVARVFRIGAFGERGPHAVGVLDDDA
jgi:hypothetical protein